MSKTVQAKIESNAPVSHSMMQQLMEIARASVLEEMASGIAHELNQPLGAIATYAQTGERMLNRPTPMIAEALSVFRQIAAEAMGAGAGIRTIRRLFNNEASNKTRQSIGHLLCEVFPLLKAMAHRAGGELSVEVQPDLPEVMADALRIQHALLTLVQNAFEASGSAALVQVRVTGDRYGIELSVLDSGCGIPENARANIFRPFYTTKTRGTGLGLASTRAIVEAHEGAIGFEDAPGGGTRFWFRLPATS
ncbi:MAG TPA: HAMP domain-containing sensor histidine kinase [Steroidobacter sp.]|jgi:signal transduction histidine kinase|nr:HAMP domain-containing sensor histidine kinase [Steroidobacter sp.]